MTDEQQQPQSDFIHRLKSSTPTLVGVEAFNIVHELLNPYPQKVRWVMFSSEFLGMEQAINAAEYYTTIMSAVQLSEEEKIYTPSPAHIFYCSDTDNPNKIAESSDFVVYGLLYSNGAVALFENKKEDGNDLLLVWIERSEADSFGIQYVDPTEDPTGFQ